MSGPGCAIGEAGLRHPGQGAAGNFPILVTSDPQLPQAITFIVQQSIQSTHHIEYLFLRHSKPTRLSGLPLRLLRLVRFPPYDDMAGRGPAGRPGPGGRFAQFKLVLLGK